MWHKTSLLKILGFDMKHANFAGYSPDNREIFEGWGVHRFCSSYVGIHDDILEYASLILWELEASSR